MSWLCEYFNISVYKYIYLLQTVYYRNLSEIIDDYKLKPSSKLKKKKKKCL
jgi:hypothetical protein